MGDWGQERLGQGKYGKRKIEGVSRESAKKISERREKKGLKGSSLVTHGDYTTKKNNKISDKEKKTKVR